MTDITLIYVFHVRALKSVIYLQNEPKMHLCFCWFIMEV